MSGKRRLSRRAFVGSAGVAGLLSSALVFDPVAHLIRSIVSGRIFQSRSRSLGNTLKAQPARNLVQVHLYGAPSRWFFDHPLRPSDSDGFVPCHGLYNRFDHLDLKAPHLARGSYADVKLRGINMPHLWRYDVARAGGGTRPMADLLANMLMIRGCNIRSEAHPLNSERVVCPVPGDFSITGLVADATDVFIPAISVGQTPANRAYKSPLGTGVVDIPSDHADYVSFLLDVFYQQSPGSYRNLASVDQQIESAVGALEAYSRSNQPGATQLYRERRRSEQLLRRGIRDLGDVFMPLVRKYDDLFQRSMTLSAVAGVTDLAVPGLQFPCEAEGDPDVLHALGSHHLMGKLLCVPDLREMYHKAVAQNLAKQFALAEFALTEGLSSSILLASPRERGHTLLGVEAGISYSVADIEKKYDPAAKRSRFSVRHDAKPIEIKMNVEHDAHTNGWVSNTLVCTLFYRGFSACLIELIDRLKQTPLAGGTLFDETVIQYATEYERVPAEDGGGSGHNGSAYVTSLYSGIIPGPMVLGNIRVGRTPDQGHPAGTLGDAAPVEGLPNHIINVGNVSSTLSEMLRVPRIVPRAVPLVTVEKGRVVPTVPPGKNVEDENV